VHQLGEVPRDGRRTHAREEAAADTRRTGAAHNWADSQESRSDYVPSHRGPSAGPCRPAEAVLFAIAQPIEVSIAEIVVRPPKQLNP